MSSFVKFASVLALSSTASMIGTGCAAHAEPETGSADEALTADESACGVGIREGDGLITTNTSRFVPHQMTD